MILKSSKDDKVDLRFIFLRNQVIFLYTSKLYSGETIFKILYDKDVHEFVWQL